MGTAGQIAKILCTHMHALIGMSYIQYGNIPQPIAAMTPINLLFAFKAVFGLLLLYYPFDGYFI